MSQSFRKVLFAAAVLAITRVPEIHAQVMPIQWSVHVSPGEVRQGRQFIALVRAQIPFSWHLYSTTQPSGGPIATVFAVNGQVFSAHGKVTAREPDRAFDAIAGMKSETYSDSVTFRVPVVASQSGQQTLELKVKYQSCTDRFCTPEKSAIVRAIVSVMPATPGKL